MVSTNNILLCHLQNIKLHNHVHDNQGFVRNILIYLQTKHNHFHIIHINHYQFIDFNNLVFLKNFILIYNNYFLNNNLNHIINIFKYQLHHHIKHNLQFHLPFNINHLQVNIIMHILYIFTNFYIQHNQLFKKEEILNTFYYYPYNNLIYILNNQPHFYIQNNFNLHKVSKHFISKLFYIFVLKSIKFLTINYHEIIQKSFKRNNFYLKNNHQHIKDILFKFIIHIPKIFHIFIHDLKYNLINIMRRSNQNYKIHNFLYF